MSVVLWVMRSTATVMVAVVGVSCLVALGFVAVLDRLDRWAEQ